MKEFFQTLFDSGEGICTGNAYATEVQKWAKPEEFFCINPLDTLKDHGAFLDLDKYSEYSPRRADLNVTCFRNFMFEMDSIELEDQLDIFRNSEIPFTSIVYSGGKSYHAILSVDGGACEGSHTRLGVEEYKSIWRRLAAKIDKEALRFGYSYPKGSNTFVDHSCKNPSRLSRYPDISRSNGKVQELVQLTERLPKSEFLQLLSECPTIYTSERKEFDTPEDELVTSEQFQAAASPRLLRELKIVDWGGPENMYRHLYRLTCWAVEETNVSEEALLDFLEEYTFCSLRRCGYPDHKMRVGVDHALRKMGK